MPSTWIEIATIWRRLPDLNGSWKGGRNMRWAIWNLEMNVLKLTSCGILILRSRSVLNLIPRSWSVLNRNVLNLIQRSRSILVQWCLIDRGRDILISGA